MTTQAKQLALTPEPAASSTALTPLDLLQMAVSKGTDLAQLERLMDLKERWDATEARRAFVVAMNAFKADPPELEKTKEVKFGTTHFKHATLDKVCAIVGAALSAHGISHRWEVSQDEKNIKVTCILTHELGHSERVTMQAQADTSGSKNAIQAIGSAVTYLQRYTLLAATGLAAKDQDDDGQKSGNGEPISAEQKEELIALIRETGTDTAGFLEFAKVSSLDEIQASAFPMARGILEAKKKRASK